MTESIIMSRTSQKRLQKDIIDIIRSPLSDNGIFYAHDENNMLQGYAIIFGPSDTIYRYGAYYFRFKFPTDYPFSPPKVTFLTGDGETRFHPNLYRNGKVCISILNTWKGEQWTSCLNIRSILLMLVTLFHNKPLLNEPGIKETHKDFIAYNRVITHQNIAVAMFDTLSKRNKPEACASFRPLYIKHVNENKEQILRYIKSFKKEEKSHIHIGLYNFKCTIDYKTIYKKIKKILIEL